MIKKFALSAACCVFASLAARAQFFIGGGVAINSYFNVGMFPAVQPRLGVDFKEGRVSLMGGFNLSPFNQSNKFNVVYASADGTEKTTVLFTEKIAVNNGFLHAAYRLGNMERAVRVKLIFGASTDLINIKYTSGRKPKASLVAEDEPTSATANGPKVDLGVGIDCRSSEKSDLNIELILGLPANQVNGEYVYNPTVTHFGLTITYSHYFGKRDYSSW